MTTLPTPDGFDPTWLGLREPADRAARAGSLVAPLIEFLGATPLVVHDLGSGTGSMARWLAPLLPAPQRWVLHDHDPALLAEAERRCTGLLDATARPVEVETRTTDLSRLDASDLTGAGLVTASALLDLLTTAEVDALAAACVTTGCPALLTLSVAGHVELEPAGEHDRALATAFDAHQRRTVAGRRLLGPDAAGAAVAAFARHGWSVRTAESDWRLGPERSRLTAEWLRGWVAAAVEQEPTLRDAALRALDERLRSELRATVAHRDVLALPAPAAIPTKPGVPT